MSNPPRPAALESHPHRTPIHLDLYDQIRELAVLQSSGWHRSGVSPGRIRALHPAAGHLIEQLADWGVWTIEPYGPLGFRITWSYYSLIVQGNETHG